jgi:hypothetical protein
VLPIGARGYANSVAMADRKLCRASAMATA